MKGNVIQEMNKIAVYIPNYNGADFLRKVYIPKGCDCVVMDNRSTDDSVNVCGERGFICVENETLVSRTENWLRCINHFRTQSYEWMKWLFIGDELKNDSYQIMTEAAANAKGSAVVLFDYYINTGSRNTVKSWMDHFEPGVVENKVAKLSYIEKGSFASPICIMLSKNCDFDRIDLTGLSWAADVRMLDQLIGDCSIYYCNRSVGVFNSRQRKTYSLDKRKLSSYLETMYVMYSSYRNFRMQYPDTLIDGSWFQNHMIDCLTDNINSGKVFFLITKSLLRGLGKLIFKKNGGDLRI
jgi:hypothetical protein